jgi:plastocyanin
MRTVALLTVVALLTFVAATLAVQAADWHAIAGGQSRDKGKQALAFLPNELWVHAGDHIIWTFPTDEIHTVSFLKTIPPPAQVRPAFQDGCAPPAPGTTPSGSAFNGTSCVNSGILSDGQTYNVVFPAAGNFKLVCLVHVNMTGVVHVLNVPETLPHDQAFYNRLGNDERSELLSDGSRLHRRAIARAEKGSGDGENGNGEEESGNKVSTGIGEILGTGAGSQTVSVMRFLPGTTEVHVGDTVEWTNLEAVTNHTVTFGVEPLDLMPPSLGVTTDSDGSRHAVIGSPAANVNSGFLGPERQDRVGLVQTPAGITRFRVTFTAPGIFNYICGLHDDLGMVGRVVVQP